MDARFLAGFALALLAIGAVPAFAQSDADTNGVVINEIDINPIGNDYATIAEWVELYNPTDADVYIGGWRVGSDVFPEKTLVIPEGTIIKAGGFEVFSYTTSWFGDVKETATLYDKEGAVMDRTPAITDPKDDYTSWQRIYDGYDNDSVSDWQFTTYTIGQPNGKPESTQEDDMLKVTINTDKDEFLFGEYVTISGNVSEKISLKKPLFGAAAIKILVDGPASYYKEISLYPDSALNYETSLSLQKVLGAARGAYAVSVEYAGATAGTQFSVDDEKAAADEKKILDLSISFDRDSYIPGQTAVITAKTSEILPFEGLDFKIEDPDGAQIYDGILYPDGEGIFTTSVYMNAISPVFGDHTITAEYSATSATATFALLDEVLEDRIISLNTDKQVYEPGETVDITGRLNNHYLLSLDLEIQQVGSTSLDLNPSLFLKETGSVRLKGDSTFGYTFEIGNGTERLGEYRVRVYKDIGEAELFFKVVENSADYVRGDDSPLTVGLDKAVYDSGSKFVISGKVNQILQSSTLQTPVVDIQIIKSDGKTIKYETSKYTRALEPEIVEYSLTAIPDIGGNYMVEDTLYALTYQPGKYIIKASYADNTHIAFADFTVVDPLDIKGFSELVINKSVFGLGEQVKVDGVIPFLSQGSGVTIVLYKPDGDTEEFGKLLDNSKFSWSWMTPSAEIARTVVNDRAVTGTNYGVYQAVFSTDSESKNVFFKVSANPESDTLSTLPIEVSTDKDVYNSGDDVVISGVAQKKVQGREGLVVEERAKIVIKHVGPPFTELFDAYLYLDNGGRFKTELSLPVAVFGEGDYKVTASYNRHRADTVFSVDNDFRYGGDEKLALILETDKDGYSPGDSVQITGRLSKLVHLDTVEITVTHERLDKITCGSFICGSPGDTVTVDTTESGSFSHTYKIPEDKTGNYRISASTEFGTFDLGFNVTDPDAEPTPEPETEPEAEPEPAAPASRVIEKFSRIPDANILISTGITTQDGDSLLPRTLQGTLLTSVKGAQDSVNIKLVSPDGTCVIGPAGCLVSESTRSPGGIYSIVDIDGKSYKVRYSGPDVQLEKFTILPSSDDFIHVENWDVEILKDEQPSRFYYKITRIAQE